MSREGALWIGGLESYMDENFLTAAVQASGETGLVSVKVIKNKFTGEPATYGFINFDNDHNALLAMHRLNGKVIPNSSPAARYKLNHQSSRLGPGERDYSIWVGDLSPEVDDLQMYKFFSARYQSVKSCKVVMDTTGYSKGYGFIRFGQEHEQQSALASMQGLAGLGSKPIKVSPAVPKTGRGGGGERDYHHHQGGHHGGGGPPRGPAAADPASADYSQYWQNQYGQYWSQYAAWSQYSQYYDQQQQQQQPPPSSYYAQPDGSAAGAAMSSAVPSSSGANNRSSGKSWNKADKSSGGKQTAAGDDDSADEIDLFHGDDLELVDHSPKLDYDKLNAKFLRRSEDLWTAIESSFWWQEQDKEDATLTMQMNSTT